MNSNKKNTRDNKIVAIIMFILGFISLIITDDATAFVLFNVIFVIPLMLAKQNYIS